MAQKEEYEKFKNNWKSTHGISPAPSHDSWRHNYRGDEVASRGEPKEIRIPKAKSEVLKKKKVDSYQPNQMYSDEAMKRFSAKRKRLGHDK